MNIMLNKTARAAVSEEYHQAFFDPFYPVIGAVSALVLICIVACVIYREHIDVDFVKYNSDRWAKKLEERKEARRRSLRRAEERRRSSVGSPSQLPLFGAVDLGVNVAIEMEHVRSAAKVVAIRGARKVPGARLSSPILPCGSRKNRRRNT